MFVPRKRTFSAVSISTILWIVILAQIPLVMIITWTVQVQVKAESLDRGLGSLEVRANFNFSLDRIHVKFIIAK